MGDSELQIAETLTWLERPELTRESISLLVGRLLGLKNPGHSVVMPKDGETNLVDLDGLRTRIFIHNLIAECDRYPTERLEIVERYLKVFFPGSDEDQETAGRDSVVALVRDSSYLNFVDAGEQDVTTKHLVGDLWIIYAVDRPSSTTVLSIKEMERLGLTPDDLASVGKINSERLLNDIKTVSYGGWFSLSSQNREYLSSTLLLDYAWNQVGALVEGDLVVAVPARDTVIFTGNLNPDGLRTIREESEYVVSNGHHVISTTLLRRVSGTWKLFL